MQGTTMGKYRLEELLGEGGMGEVYRGFDVELQRPVAVKLIRGEILARESTRKRFLREARIVAGLNHPSIVQVYDLVSWEDRQAIVMELIEGTSLDRILRIQGRLRPSRTLRLLRQIAEGLAAAHEKGVIHRDLKPANVMITMSGGKERAKLLDFGLAKHLEREEEAPERESALTDRGGIVGTLRYMSPEQANARELDERSDLFSLGVSAYEALSGISPFSGREIEEILIRICTVWPDPLEELDPVIPRELSDLVYQLLQKDRNLRPRRATQVVDALERMERRLTIERAAIDSHGGTVDLRSDLSGAVTIIDSEASDAARTVLRTLVCASVDEPQESTHELLAAHEGLEAASEDGLLALFERPASAVSFALELQTKNPRARIGVHLGEVLLKSGEVLEADGPPKLRAASLAHLAEPGQTLLSRAAFDLARRGAFGGFWEEIEEPQWLAHGEYRLASLGDDEAGDEAATIEVFEVGLSGAPLRAPEETPEARRVLEQGVVPGWRPAPGHELPGRPHWLMERKVGLGGAGEVWLARHQKTGEPRVFKFCWETAKLRSLQREVTIFRLLKEELGNRNDITRILDWSLDEAPYFIEAEYTEGGHLQEWIEREGGFGAISLESRLEIVAQIADALAAAHAVGVLHKDVKPQNVLIRPPREDDGAARAQLTDFGIGRLTDQQLLSRAGITALGMTETQLAEATGSSYSGTRIYMAPEVVEGRAATLQADIYGLGVMLYQLIVEDFSRSAAPGWERDVDDELLREDLASAIDGSPQRRLADVSQLAERLRSLEARRAERAERRRQEEDARRAQRELERSRRRRRILAGMASVFLLATVVSAGFWLRAEREATSAQATVEFLMALFEQPDPYESGDPDMSLEEFLDAGASKISQDLAEQPLIQARLMNAIGVSQLNLGLHEEAEELIAQALEIRREELGTDHLAVAESLFFQGEIRYAQNRLEKAYELFDESLIIRRKKLEAGDLRIAKNAHALGRVTQALGRLDEAQEWLDEALTIRKESLGERHEDVAEVLLDISLATRDQGDAVKAEELCRTALGIYEEVFGDEHVRVGSAMGELAIILAYQARRDEAEPIGFRAKEIVTNALGDHLATAIATDNFAIIKLSQGDYENAGSYFQEGLEIRRRVLDPDDPGITSSMMYLAYIYRVSDKLEEAEKLLREALTRNQKELGPDHPQLAQNLEDLANVLLSREDLRGVEEMIHEALEIRRSTVGEDHVDFATSQRLLARYESVVGNFAESEHLLREVLAPYRRDFGERHPSVGALLVELAEAVMKKGDCEVALKESRLGLEILEEDPDSSSSPEAERAAEIVQHCRQ